VLAWISKMLVEHVAGVVREGEDKDVAAGRGGAQDEAVAGHCGRRGLLFLRPLARTVGKEATDVGGVVEGGDVHVKVGLLSGNS